MGSKWRCFEWDLLGMSWLAVVAITFSSMELTTSYKIHEKETEGLQVTARVSKCHCEMLWVTSSSSKSCPLQQLSNAKQSLPRHFSVDKCGHYPTPYISRIIHTVTTSSWSCIWANNSFARNWLHNGAEGQRIGPKAQRQSVVFAWKAFYTALIIHSRRTW